MLYPKILSLLLFSSIVLLLFVPTVTSSPESSGFMIFKESGQALASSYESVYAAERSGANVTSLINQLNLAGDYFSEAYAQFYLGNYQNAGYFAGLCRDSALDVKKNAEALNNNVNVSEGGDFFATQLGSIVAVISFLILGYVAWRVFKSNYRKNILRMKPEVFSNES